MHALLRLLPHLLTLTNLAAGCIACISLVRGDFAVVPWCLLLSAVADFLDGFAARAAGVSGPFGRELDSLADMVSFGLSPALMAVVMMEGRIVPWPIGGDPNIEVGIPQLGMLLGLAIALASAVRLARFNVEQSDTKHFIGLATPANTLLWFGLFMTWATDSLQSRELLSTPPVVLALVALTSYLLVSNFAYFSNKLNPAATRNWPVWFVAAAFLVLPWFIGWASIPVAMALYVLSPLVWRPEELRI